MGWSNGPPTWSELERVLSGKPSRRPAEDMHPGDGGDSPAWSRKRGAYEADSIAPPTTPTVPYAELHAHSAYSFLDGASQPEELVEEAVRLGLSALALTDHNGFYGTVRFAEAAREWGMPTVFGAELSLGTDAEAAPGRGASGPRRCVTPGGPRPQKAGLAADTVALGPDMGDRPPP
ncbi:PHP domain-containing protein, partial [Nocardia sp. NPDC058497]|uniref:PHP domain-containing protein n=1 Tax=Nocardia sp. NPDC058497 TaxID=3346529 RepID=UPI003651DE9C